MAPGSRMPPENGDPPARTRIAAPAERGIIATALPYVRPSVAVAAVAGVVNRVAEGGCPPSAPTDPDVWDYHIRLFGGIGSLGR
jgi:hypothetical protein